MQVYTAKIKSRVGFLRSSFANVTMPLVVLPLVIHQGIHGEFMTRSVRLALVLVLALGVARVTVAAPLDDAFAAYDKGDYATALPIIRGLSEGGDAAAQWALGLMYQRGSGVGQNFDAAAEWYRRSAEQGYALGQNNLAILYMEGMGVFQDNAEAAIWFRRAADQGFVGAQTALGRFYEIGRGVPQDFDEALAWYTRAADQGSPAGYVGIGKLYANGRGVPLDEAKAVGFFRMAADQGFADGALHLGAMYGEGRGAERDYVQAYMWFEVARRDPNYIGPAVANRQITAALMTPEQITEAQRLALLWKPK